MVKYEPNFFIFPREKVKFPEDKVRQSSSLCKNEPAGIGEIASFFLETMLSEEQKDTIILNKNKTKVLPGKLCEKIEISSIYGHTLLLKAKSSVWRAETMAFKNNIIAACNKVLGKNTIKTIKIS